MKSIVSVFVLLFVILDVGSANHHKKHKVSQKNEDIAGDGSDNGFDGDFEWPHPERVLNFGVPEAFKQGASGNIRYAVSTSTPPHHGRSNHKAHSH